VPCRTKNIANLLGKGGESLEIFNLCVNIRKKEATCLAPCLTVTGGLNALKILPAIWTLLAPSKNTKSTIPGDVFL
jgi:hypothetical protein